jgi:hypothetical protein
LVPVGRFFKPSGRIDNPSYITIGFQRDILYHLAASRKASGGKELPHGIRLARLYGLQGLADAFLGRGDAIIIASGLGHASNSFQMFFRRFLTASLCQLLAIAVRLG